MQVEYISLCKSISRLDLRCLRRRLARETALTLNSLRISFLRFVASVCSKIARCIMASTIIIRKAKYKNAEDILNLVSFGDTQLPPHLKIVGILCSNLR